jgi:hypothetical protein
MTAGYGVREEVYDLPHASHHRDKSQLKYSEAKHLETLLSFPPERWERALPLAGSNSSLAALRFTVPQFPEKLQ